MHIFVIIILFFSGQTIVTRLQTANPNLLDGLRMQFHGGLNEEEPQPNNGYHDDEPQS